MDRAEMKQQAHEMLDQLSNRQLEAVLGVLRCFTGYDEADAIPTADEGEGLPPANIFGKFFSS
jgi:hypothetical protein